MPNAYLEEDPRGLIHEAYQMDLGAEEARSIFLDWALRDLTAEPFETIRIVLDHYEGTYPDHPMTAVLVEGLTAQVRPRRRRRAGGDA
jgi:hypothetical protein